MKIILTNMFAKLNEINQNPRLYLKPTSSQKSVNKNNGQLITNMHASLNISTLLAFECLYGLN